jgi:DnaJ family protein A protein 2
MASDKKDLYAILEISKTASEAEISSAYKRLARIWHPDKNKSPEAKLKFQDIQHAHQILSDPEKRAHYDNFGSEDGGPSIPGGIDPRDIFSHVFGGAGGGGIFGGGFPGVFGGAGGGFPGGFSEMFRGPQFRRKGIDTQKKIPINIIQMMNGDTFKLKHSRIIACDYCIGQGHNSSGNFTCPLCKGTKQQTQQIRLGPNMISTQVSPCRQCSATGKYIPEKDKCTHCKGVCVLKINEEFTIDVPRGAKNGDSITFSHKGDYDPSNMNADSEYGSLVIIFQEEKDTTNRWKRVENDLFTIHDILLSEAICGLDKKILHPDGHSYRVIHNQIITPGMKHKVPGLGFPDGKGGRGNLVITFNIVFPKELGERQKEFLLKLLPKRRELTETEKAELTDIYLEEYEEPKINFTDDTEKISPEYDEEQEMKECVIC